MNDLIEGIILEVSEGELDVTEGTEQILSYLTESEMIDKNEFRAITVRYKNDIKKAKTLMSQHKYQEAKETITSAKRELQKLKDEVKAMDSNTSKDVLVFVGKTLKASLIVGGIITVAYAIMKKDFDPKMPTATEVWEKSRKDIEDIEQKIGLRDKKGNYIDPKKIPVGTKEFSKKLDKFSKEMNEKHPKDELDKYLKNDKLREISPSKNGVSAGVQAGALYAGVKLGVGIYRNRGVSKDILNTAKTKYIGIINKEIANCNKIITKLSKKGV